jgi:glycosyltransferase involved in cell wall biosynthesis
VRVLIAAFVNTDHPGVLRKVHEQTVALREYVPETIGLAIGDNSRKADVDGLACSYVDVPGGAYNTLTRAACFHVLWEAVQKLQPDIVYFRYPMYDSHTLRFVRDVPATVFEIQTKAESEFPPQVAAADNEYARRVLPLARGVVAVTAEILDYELARGGASRAGHVMSNGMNAESVPFTPAAHTTGASGIVEMICAAQFAHWHGIDRILAGMALTDPGQRNRMLLHLAGEGDVVPAYRDFVREFGLGGQVNFHGRLSRDELTPLFARSRIAIGSLALHRIGLSQLAVLKNREYCLRGIPFVFAGEDVDFDSSLPFVRTFAQSDDPILPSDLLQFAEEAGKSGGTRAGIRKYGEERLSWRTKMRGLAEFLSTLA